MKSSALTDLIISIPDNKIIFLVFKQKKDCQLLTVFLYDFSFRVSSNLNCYFEK